MKRTKMALRLSVVLAVIIGAIALLCSCADKLTYEFYVKPSATEIGYGESVTFACHDLELDYWSIKCLEGYEIENIDKDKNTFTVTPTEEGRVYLRFSAYTPDYSGPISQTVAIDVVREERVITTADELLMATDEKVRYILGADIDMSSVSSFEPKEFSGALDGKGHVIKNLSYIPTGVVKDMNVGIWSVNKGIIENIVFENVNISVFSEALSAGMVAGVNDGTVGNVTVKGSLNAAQTTNVGGICGMNNGTVSGCSSEAIVEGKENTGGIAGVSISAINGSRNDGRVDGTKNVGGIIGRVTSSCAVTGNQNGGYVEGNAYVGGIIGLTDDGQIVQINSSENSGEVSGTQMVGGVVGGGSSAVVFACNNRGVINAYADYVGGVGGSVYSVRRCENSGAVTAEGRDITSDKGYFAVYVGGIAGYAREVSECSNRQRISVDAEKGMYIGGVVGYLDGADADTKLNGNYNEGEITSAKSSKYIGGVIGFMKNASLRGTENAGDVNGGGYTAGVVGFAESGGIYFTTNRGTVRASGAKEICHTEKDSEVTIFNSVTEGSTGQRDD